MENEFKEFVEDCDKHTVYINMATERGVDVLGQLLDLCKDDLSNFLAANLGHYFLSNSNYEKSKRIRDILFEPVPERCWEALGVDRTKDATEVHLNTIVYTYYHMAMAELVSKATDLVFDEEEVSLELFSEVRVHIADAFSETEKYIEIYNYILEDDILDLTVKETLDIAIQSLEYDEFCFGNSILKYLNLIEKTSN